MKENKHLELTARQKKIRDDPIKTIGNVSHPTDRKIDKKQISTGIVMRNNVVITSRLLTSGGESYLMTESGDIIIAVACNPVEMREMAIDPTAPGRPMQVFQSTRDLHTRRPRTAYDDSKQCKPTISRDKDIENDASSRTNCHGSK